MLKSLSSSKESCERFRLKLEEIMSEMMAKPSQSTAQIKKESLKALHETQAAISKRFSQARYGLAGMFVVTQTLSFFLTNSKSSRK